MSEFIVADDHPLMCAGIKQVVATDRLINLTAYAQTGGERLELISRRKPDVVLIDANISLPGGPQILNELRANRCKTQVCFLTKDEDQVSSNAPRPQRHSSP